MNGAAAGGLAQEQQRRRLFIQLEVPALIFEKLILVRSESDSGAVVVAVGHQIASERIIEPHQHS